MLAEGAAQLNAEQASSGQSSIWREVYNTMRCTVLALPVIRDLIAGVTVFVKSITKLLLRIFYPLKVGRA
jgi:hypothetical protein